ncbi:MAG: hypothetical protein K2M88_07980 [Muribaculaceae bacterium]|nr:hypothetical protein [Muribaculaceae bacterium]
MISKCLNQFNYQYCKNILDTLVQHGVVIDVERAAWTAVNDVYTECDFISFVEKLCRGPLFNIFYNPRQKDIDYFCNLIYNVEVKDGDFRFFYVKDIPLLHTDKLDRIQMGHYSTLILTYLDGSLKRATLEECFGKNEISLQDIDCLLPESMNEKKFGEEIKELLLGLSLIPLPNNSGLYYNLIPNLFDSKGYDILSDYLEDINIQVLQDFFIRNTWRENVILCRDYMYTIIKILKEIIPDIINIGDYDKIKKLADKFELDIWAISCEG